MVKALVLDIDGILVGEKIGFNTPEPHADVLARLANIHLKNIPIVLCTAKPHYSITKIIESANLTNPHITLAGGVIIDPIQNSIMESHPFPKATALEILSVLQPFYTELYTLDGYAVTQHIRLTDVHTHILQREPVFVESLDAVAQSNDTYKILPIVPDESEIAKVSAVLQPFYHDIEITWSVHPIANPHQFCNIAPSGISKRQATLHVLSHLGIDPAHVLSVGDSASDWKFMELTGYVATLESGQEPLKKLVSDRGDSGFIGKHVDENGILSILDYFHLPISDTHP